MFSGVDESERKNKNEATSCVDSRWWLIDRKMEGVVPWVRQTEATKGTKQQQWFVTVEGARWFLLEYPRSFLLILFSFYCSWLTMRRTKILFFFVLIVNQWAFTNIFRWVFDWCLTTFKGGLNWMFGFHFFHRNSWLNGYLGLLFW